MMQVKVLEMRKLTRNVMVCSDCTEVVGNEQIVEISDDLLGKGTEKLGRLQPLQYPKLLSDDLREAALLPDQSRKLGVAWTTLTCKLR
jgi:hypothetical protein